MLQLLVAIIGAISLLFSCGDRVSLLSGQGNNISAESEIQENFAEQETENAKSGDKTAGLEYNDYIGTEKGIPLTTEEAEKILLSDISDEDWEIFEDSNEKISQIVAEYSDENGYISSDATETVINAVAQQVEELYKDGIVTYYSCGLDSVTFEYACGITAYYEPDLEGYSSGSGSTDIIAIDPFATGTANDSMKNQARQSGNSINYALVNEMNDGVSMVSYKDEEVTVSQLKDLEECTFFLWNGHGGMATNGDEKYPILYTRQKASGKPTGFRWTANAVVGEVEEDGLFWAITPNFVEKYFKIEDGLAYLSACHSGQNDTLANAFMDAGAEVVFVNAGEGAINTIYTQYMMELIMGYMCGSYDDIFHTANEALEWAETDFAEAFSDGDTVTVEIDEEEVICTTAEEYIEKVNGGSHTELRGVGGYTLCSCIRGEITFEDDVTQDEINEILEGLTVRLETEDGQLVYDVSANTDATFYFNNLDSDTTYMATLYQNEKQICQPVSVKTIEHRYRSLSIPYAQLVTLEGYVYDQEGNPLADVTVNADMTIDQALWNTSALTDENGYYSLKVYGENTYTLGYMKEGYTGQEINFEVTSELFEEAQEGTPCKLEDVELLIEYAELKGYVYDQNGNRLSEVSVSAKIDAGDNLWNATAVTDENGYYCLKVFGKDSYKINYEKDGYLTQNNSFNVSGEIFTNSQEGVSYQMKDVILEKEMSSLDEMIWELSSDGVLTISGTGKMDSYHDLDDVPWYSERKSITSVIIKDGITSISSMAFYDCSSMKSIVIPNSVTKIGQYAFMGCTSLSDIDIPGSVTSIGISAFFNCINLTSIVIPDGVTEVANVSFGGCVNLSSVTIPDGVTKIGNRAFYSCSSLTSMTIPSDITRIDEGAFEYCTGLTNVVIPDSVTKIGEYAFKDCSSLTSIKIPNSVTSIGYAAFSGCSNLINVIIPDGVTSIEGGTFSRCTHLTSVTIPSSVTKIRNGAFAGAGLSDVYFQGTESDWYAISIGSDNENLIIAMIHYE